MQLYSLHLHPFTFDDGTLLYSGGGNTHPFRERDFLFLHGSKHGASTAHIVLAGVISIVLPINLLVGLRTKGAVY